MDISQDFKICINTSSQGKIEEFKKFLGNHIEFVKEDLKEPDSDPLTIIRYKASQFENILVDDTSLEIPGAEIGSNIKWVIDQLGEYEGKTALFICLLGIQKENKIYVYKGEVSGTIVKPRGIGFGFNPYFKPLGAAKTYAEDKPNSSNARYLAVQSFILGKAAEILEPLPDWDGLFQKS
jgi:inosine/xanthosine triphosphate pyrophosphatase family protein